LMFGLRESRIPVPTALPALGSLGHYQLLERVGTGGFGCVYRAWDPQLSRFVAIKTCDVGAEEVRERFAREARLAASLSHPNIVSIFDFRRDGGVLFLVQEFLEGEDLDEKIRRGQPGELVQKLRILDEISAGLAHAHARGVVHRDIKPGNVRILETGTAKILDFGIARAVNEDLGITRPGQMIGSAGYMAPEQIEGGPIDHRTDLFGLGVLAYELLSGCRAFTAESLSGLFDAILHDEPEPLSLLTDAPPLLDELVRDAMAKELTARPASAVEFRTRLARIAASQARPAPAVARRPATRRLRSLLALG
jgi:serine/threonine protein kinase